MGTIVHRLRACPTHELLILTAPCKVGSDGDFYVTGRGRRVAL